MGAGACSGVCRQGGAVVEVRSGNRKQVIGQPGERPITAHLQEAFAEFVQLLSRYPGSPYAADAKARMVYLRNMMARHEINIANYYFRRGAYMAATNRGRYVVENFERTPAVADGLVGTTGVDPAENVFCFDTLSITTSGLDQVDTHLGLAKVKGYGTTGNGLPWCTCTGCVSGISSMA